MPCFLFSGPPSSTQVRSGSCCLLTVGPWEGRYATRDSSVCNIFCRTKLLPCFDLDSRRKDFSPQNGNSLSISWYFFRFPGCVWGRGRIGSFFYISHLINHHQNQPRSNLLPQLPMLGTKNIHRHCTIKSPQKAFDFSPFQRYPPPSGCHPVSPFVGSRVRSIWVARTSVICCSESWLSLNSSMKSFHAWMPMFSYVFIYGMCFFSSRVNANAQSSRRFSTPYTNLSFPSALLFSAGIFFPGSPPPSVLMWFFFQLGRTLPNHL